MTRVVTGVVHGRPNFRLVAEHFGKRVATLQMELDDACSELDELLSNPVLVEGRGRQAMFDSVHRASRKRIDLKTMLLLMSDEEFQYASGTLCEAWRMLSDELTPHEAEKMLRDTSNSRESHAFLALRRAWRPVQRIAQRLLDEHLTVVVD